MILAYIFAGIGVLFALLSAFFLYLGNNCADILGYISTIISIVLGLVSIVYTYHSGKKTEDTLSEIKNQNKMFVEKITEELCDNNYGRQNLENIKEKIGKH